MFINCCLFVLFVGTIPDIISSTNPGLKARITPAGLNYATKVAIDTLSQKLVGNSIPDQHGKAGDVSYDLTQLKVTNFIKPQSSISLNPPTGLRWAASGIGLSLHGDWHYKYKKGWIKISDSGSFDVSVNRLSFSLTIGLGTDAQGRPSISSNSCSCGIDSVDVHFHGGASWIYNIFKGQIGDKIRDMLRGKMCDIIHDAIDNDAEKALKKLQVKTKIANVFMLDYRLVSNPAFTSSYMETYHKGEVFWASDMKEAPMPVPPLPTMADTKHMLYLWVSDYLFNTLTYEAQIHGVLTYNLTAKDLPPSSREALNTTCLKGFCIGQLIPQISMKYPNRQVELRMKSKRTPVMTAVENSIRVLCGGLIDMYATLPNKPSVYLLTLNTSMNATVNLSVMNEKIFGKVEKLDFKVSALNSTVGKISDKALQFVVDSALRLFVEPKLNDLGQKGFPLPTTGNIKFVNTKLVLAKDTLIVATDVHYGSDKDTALKFVPEKRVYLNSDGYRFQHL